MAHAAANKQHKYADVHASRKASLVVFGKAQEAPPLLRACARHAWSTRWWALVSVGVQRAIAEALLWHAAPDLLPSPPAGTALPLADVLACQ